AATERWQRLAGEVPTGFYLSTDLDPDKGLLHLMTNTRQPGDTKNCDALYPVRTTYGCRLDAKAASLPLAPQAQQPLAKRPREESGRTVKLNLDTIKALSHRLRSLPTNQWVLLAN